MIPFFVADRPMSLEIIKSFWSSRPKYTIGLMTHAQTSDRFRRLFKLYPCIDTGKCSVCGTTRAGDTSQCDVGQRIAKSVVKMGDSGIFADEADRLEYGELFSRYEEMGVEFGIAIDYLHDPVNTIESARAGRLSYLEGEYNFNLVLVAQGPSVDDYLDCYEKLGELGDSHVAIGGLLRRKINSARYVSVRRESLMDSVLQSIREKFDPDWLFALGIYHPSRHAMLESNGVTGADYKGWIFNYRHKRDLVSESLRKMAGLQISFDSRVQELVEWRVLLEGYINRRTGDLGGNLPSDERKKAHHIRRGALETLGWVDQKILDELRVWASQDRHQSPNSDASSASLDEIGETMGLLSQSERRVRFAGVHDYFNQQLVPKLKSDDGANQTSRSD